jgi:hypothetical protein
MVWFGISVDIYIGVAFNSRGFNKTFNVHKDPNLKIEDAMDIFAYLLVDAILNRVEKIRNE